ncbi:MAG TPA: dUTP diphosphatase [Aquifex aeolicus]|uniref:dUTP diphosphatase n=1 Tax=Aquifex aeolicus TaxID=63363 RepID=A0A9D1CF02_AQUAO|nr:dUTP diphosphatase [Aquificales bacterium]HIP98425.1 dUTP diphosphatase [Aquifex aeolicus]HIQ26343.1 dUTP diphosphatase [Aquifex aeolicus]
MGLRLKVKKLREDARLPVRKRKGDAGLDLYSVENVILKPGEWKAVSTGIAIEIPQGYFGLVKDRSGLALKYALHCLAGVIDENYRGEVKVLLINLGNREVKLEKHSRIAQLLIVPYLETEVEESENLSDTERGEKGFGSSGLG